MSSNPSTETSSKEVIKTTAEKDEEGPAVFSSSAPALIIWDQAETGVSPPTPPLRDLPTPIITLPTPDTNDLNSIDWDTPAVIEPAKRVGEGTSGAVNPPLLSLATIPAKLLPKQPPIPTTAAAVATVNMIMSKSSSNLTRGATLKKVVANPPVIKRDEHTRPASPTASNLRLKVHSTGTDSQERDGTSPASSPPPVRKSRGPSKSTAGSITSLNPGRVRASSALSLVSIHADQLLKNQDDDPQDSYEKVVPQYSQSIKVSAPFFSQLNNTSVLPGVMQSSVSIQPEERVSDTATPLPPGFVKSTRKRSSKKYAKSTSGGENTSQKNLTSDPGEKPGRIKVDNNELIQKSIENMKAYQMTEGGGGGLGLEIHDEGEPSLKEKFGVGVAAAIANAEALNGLASPHTLTFYEHEMESGYRDYFAIYYIPMWRKALVLILAVTWGVFIYHMLVYPSDSEFFVTLKGIRDSSFPNNSWEISGCLPGFVCVPCVSGHLCNVFNPVIESVFYGGGILVPTMILFIASYKLGPGSRFNKYTHTLAICYVLILAAFPVSMRHYYVEPTITPYKTVLLYIFILFSASVLLRIRFIHLFRAFPVYITAYCSEAALTSVKHKSGDGTGFGIGLVILVSSFLVILLGSYDFERNTRAQYVQTRSVVQTNEKLVSQLTSINTTYSDKILELDTPLEKAIGLINVLRSDPKLNRHHMEALGMLTLLLNSNNLMAPDIENDTARVARDEEEEAYLFSNLYRPRPKAKNRLSVAMLEKPLISRKFSEGEERRHSRIMSRNRNMSNASSSLDSKASAASIPSLFLTSILGSTKNSVTYGEPEFADSDQSDTNGTTSTFSWTNRRMSKPSKRDSLTPEQQRKSKAFDQNAFIAVSDTKRPSQFVAQNSGVSMGASPLSPRRLSYASKEGATNVTHGDSQTAGMSLNLPVISSNEGNQKSSSSLLLPLQPNNTRKLNSQDCNNVEKPIGASDVSLSFESMNNLNVHLQMVSLLEKVDQWNWDIFDVHELSEHRPLFTLSHYLFLRNNLYNRFQINVETFLNFATEIEAGYIPEVSYHNSLHGADVLHGVNFFRNACSGAVDFTDFEIMTLYTAAMVHDFNHPGRNNNFLANTSDPLALMYNDRSVLENHHIAAAFRILLQPECNFVSKLTKEEYKEFREMMIELVLATDLQAQHFSILGMFKNKVSLTNSFDPVKVHEDRTLLFKMMIKCADVSNPTKAWPIYERWTQRILDEFFNQGDAEKSLGIPVSPYYDRDTIYIPASQMGFIDFICIPLFEAFNMYADISTPVEGIISNRAYWIVQVEAKKAAEAEAAAAAAGIVPTTCVPVVTTTQLDPNKSNKSVNINATDVVIPIPNADKDPVIGDKPVTERATTGWRSIKAMLKKEMKDVNLKKASGGNIIASNTPLSSVPAGMKLQRSMGGPV